MFEIQWSADSMSEREFEMSTRHALLSTPFVLGMLVLGCEQPPRLPYSPNEMPTNGTPVDESKPRGTKTGVEVHSPEVDREMEMQKSPDKEHPERRRP